MALKKYFALSIIAASVAMSACSSDDDDDGGETDAGMTDVGMTDAGTADAGTADAGTADAGTADAGTADAGTADAGMTDAGMTDGMEPVDLRPAPVSYTPEGDSVIDTARGTDADGDGNFEGGVDALSTLVSAVLPYGDLVDLLDDPDGNFTVFAPSNEAFDAVDLSMLDDATIRRTLSYHVVPTPEGGMALNTSALGDDQELPQTLDTAVAGAQLTVQDDGTGTVVVVDSDGSAIATGDAVPVGNGVVYVIGEVLTPPADAGMGGTDDGTDDSGTDDGGDPGTGGGGGDAPVSGSSYEAIVNDDNLSAFESLVDASGRQGALESTEADNLAQVVFAPTNSAIDPSVTTAVAYTYTGRGTGSGPLENGTYNGTGDQALTFELGGTDDALTVNGLPARFVPTTSGNALYVFGN